MLLTCKVWSKTLLKVSKHNVNRKVKVKSWGKNFSQDQLFYIPLLPLSPCSTYVVFAFDVAVVVVVVVWNVDVVCIVVVKVASWPRLNRGTPSTSAASCITAPTIISSMTTEPTDPKLEFLLRWKLSSYRDRSLFSLEIFIDDEELFWYPLMMKNQLIIKGEVRTSSVEL